MDTQPTAPDASGAGILEARIRELELRLRRFRIPFGTPAQADPETNGCTYGCTHGCTNGCTAPGCVNPEVRAPRDWADRPTTARAAHTG